MVKAIERKARAGWRDRHRAVSVYAFELRFVIVASAVAPTVNLTALGAAAGGSRGAFWGALAGLLFLNPLAGIAIGALAGAGAGALSGSLADYGINNDFVKNLGKTIPPG